MSILRNRLRTAGPTKVQRMDSTDGMSEMREVGRAIARRQVDARHFARFPAAESGDR